ncbi:MAG: BCD family MFS transporter [Anaerolineae bacterium]|nr:BCD family MFS transporter [Anaerolineae bacterium]
MFIKRLQLALIHVAVAITLVPINSTLNRVMIKEMALSATLVAALASLPYLFSPTQMIIGDFSDRHPWLGWRRSPYILLGLLLCAAGVSLAPQVVFLMPENYLLGLALSVLTFAAWGMGFNVASVSYLSLASELSGEKGRSKTVSIMWILMIIGIIITAATLSRSLENYSPQALQNAFQAVGLVALGMGLLGLVGLEKRHKELASAPIPERASWLVLIRVVMSAPQSRRFFLYLTLLLAAILGQDVLLEPFAGEAFDLPVSATTRITSIWGGCMLVSMLVAGLLEGRFSKRTVAQFSAWVAISGFVLIAASGFLADRNIFYLGVILLGVGTGLSTVSNLSLMFDMTTSKVGLFIGAWGMASAAARLIGTMMSGIVRDLVSQAAQNAIAGYSTVFIIEVGILLFSLALLRQVDVAQFRQQTQKVSLSERAAFLNDGG